MSITLQSLSLVENVELVQVCCTLHLRGQWNMWMQDGSQAYMNSYMASNGSCFWLLGILLKKLPLDVGLTQIPGDHGTPNAHNYIYIFNHVWGPTWMNIHWNSVGWVPNHIWLHTTLKDPWPCYMIAKVSGDGFWTLPLGSHDFMVMALGSSAKWPLLWHDNCWCQHQWSLWIKKLTILFFCPP